uniref:Aspartate carbamoyltransferase n=1 Tax=Alexandrium monilatum TaxID=311494 RepID=A0A7S4RF44_9DINO
METSTREHQFKGRTLAIVNDLTLDEQWYLYQKVRELKEAVRSGGDLDRFRLRNPEFAVYTIFMEDSTRTKESFRNAVEFHGMKVNVFDAKTSSFQKNETITDTIKMLCGYSIGQSIFVIRSKIEGVCRWLEEAIGEYTRSRGYPPASFINAGDGRHEHPSQELLDEFSFLEHKGWDRESIHLALLGDLFHGRTVHSKVDGLRLYGQVDVDLIAPAELALPRLYEDRMLAFGFHVRKFASIEEYLAQSKVAKIWYFTRLQLERMGEKVLDKSPQLRKAVTFQREFVGKLPPGTRFFHPLPRDARHPTLPFWLDNTELNGWDQQSQNGYFTRIILLGMFGGLLGGDFRSALATPQELPMRPKVRPSPDSSPIRDAVDFITEVKRSDEAEDSSSTEVGLVPLRSGIIIENLGAGQSVERIWGLMHMVRGILGLGDIGGQGVYRSAERPSGEARGYISVPEVDINGWDRRMLKKLTAMAPGSRLKVMEDGHISTEYCLSVPPRIYNFPDISCKNTACVSHSSNGQHEVPPYFHRAGQQSWAFLCKYCESMHDFWQIWDYKYYEASDFTI